MNADEPLPLRQAMPVLWRECRTAPPEPLDGAPTREHWHYIWRSVFALWLTWPGLVMWLVILGLAALLG